MNILCISIDGLHSGMIGAYGNSWIRTPVLDALAAESTLFDRYYARSLHLPTIFDDLWTNRFLESNRFSENTLLTDDSDVFYHERAADFDSRQLMEPLDIRNPVESLEETRFFQGFASLVDGLEQSRRKGPFFHWAHFRGFRGPWDFPMEYRRRHQDEEDPDPYAEVRPPELLCGESGETDPDELQAVMEAYSGGMSVLDDSLGALLDYLDEIPETFFVLLSTRGFSLGEHGRIGPDASLYAENVHLPLFIRFPDGFGATTRVSALAGPTDFANFLSDPHHAALVRLIDEETETLHDALRMENRAGETGLITPEWFLRKISGDESRYEHDVELYAKPDDHWEINDVADRCPEVVESLGPLLDDGPR